MCQALMASTGGMEMKLPIILAWVALLLSLPSLILLISEVFMSQTVAIFMGIFSPIMAVLVEMIRGINLAGNNPLDALAAATTANSGAIVTGLFTLFGVYIGYLGATRLEKSQRRYELRRAAYSEFVTSVYKLRFSLGDSSRNQEAVIDGYAKIQLFGGSKVASKLYEMISQKAARAGIKEIDYEEFAESVNQDLVPLMRLDLGADVPGSDKLP
jgi:hypothetical protein